VGAEMRALFGDYVMYSYEPRAKILDIGTSLYRLGSRWDMDGKSLCNRVHGTAPIVSPRDFHRQISHRNDVYLANLKEGVHYCKCVGGFDNQGCKVCRADFDAVMSVDSVYYHGVLEEMALLCSQRQIPGYFVFNDYAIAYSNHGNTGEACDNESHYLVNMEDATVRSYVDGNITPYVHPILQTRPFSWQYRLKCKTGDIAVLCEQLQRFDNGDIPYRLVRMVALEVEYLKKTTGDERFEGVVMLDKYHTPQSLSEFNPYPEGIWVKVSNVRDPPLTVSTATTEKTLVDCTTAPIMVSPDVEVRLPPELKPVPSPNRPISLEIKKLQQNIPCQYRVEDETLHIREYLTKRPIGIGDTVIDFAKRTEVLQSTWEQFKVGVSQAHQKIYITKETEVMVNMVTFHKPWYYLKIFNKAKKIYSAPLALVLACYHALGQKNKFSAVAFAVTSLQGKLTEEFANLNAVLDIYEAMGLAWVIREEQLTRLKEIVTE
jgi:hypothetical protein